MLGVDALRVTPGDRIPTDADTFNLLADAALQYGRDKNRGTLPQAKQGFGQGQWIARVQNLTGQILDVGAIVEIGPDPSSSGAYPNGWLAKKNWGEVNDQPVLTGKVPTVAGRLFGVLLEKCRADGTATVCVGGYCYARVELLSNPGGLGLADPAVVSEWAEIVPGQTGNLKMAGAGPFRVVQNFYRLDDLNPNPANGVARPACLVELQRPGSFPPVYRCFVRPGAVVATNGQSRLLASVYLPPLSGAWMIVAEIRGELASGGNDQLVTAFFNPFGQTTGLALTDKRLDHTGRPLELNRRYATSLTWLLDSVPSTGRQCDLWVYCSGTSPGAGVNARAIRFDAVKLGGITSSCSRLPPEPPVFVGSRNIYAYTEATPFTFRITVSDEATPPGSITVQVDTTLQAGVSNLPAGNVSIAPVPGFPAQRDVTITVNASVLTSTTLYLKATDGDGEIGTASYTVFEFGTTPPTIAFSPANVMISNGETVSFDWTITDNDNPTGPFTFAAVTPGTFSGTFPPSPPIYNVSDYATLTRTAHDASNRTGTCTVTALQAAPFGPFAMLTWSWSVTDPNGNVMTATAAVFLRN